MSNDKNEQIELQKRAIDYYKGKIAALKIELSEKELLVLLEFKWIRLISKRRAKVLRKRGEYVAYSEHVGFYWEPDWHCPNPNTKSGLPYLSHKEFMESA